MIGRAAAVKALVVLTVTGLLITGVPGSAAATPVVQDTPSVPAVPAAALANWPSQLLMFVSGTDQFKARYLGQSRQQLEAPLPEDSPDKANRQDPSCKDKGGDIGLYTVDFVRHLGDVLNALGNLPGQDKLGFVTTPWPGPPAAQATGGKDDGGVMPLAGDGYKYNDGDSAYGHLPDPAYIASCASDLAGYGQADATSPWGFGFYSQPDQGSIDALHAQLAAIPAHTRTSSGQQIQSGTASWDYYNAKLSTWAYNPMDVMNYCKSGDDPNPFCLSAMFLHCPDLPAATAASYQAVKDCRTFNANTVLANITLANWLNINGPDGRFHDWIQVLAIGNAWPTVRKWIMTGLIIAGGIYVGAATGAIAAGGLGRVLIGTAAAVAVTQTNSWDTIWGTVSCTADLGKCLAKSTASGMAQASDLMAKAAANSSMPKLDTAGPVLNGLAGISGMLMLIFLLLTLLTAVFTQKMGLIIVAGMGAFRWAVSIGLASTILTMLFQGSNYVSDAIAGSGGSNQSIAAYGVSLSQSALNIGGTQIVGWILVAALCLLGMLAAVVVWVVLNISYEFIPLALGLMVLQLSGLTGSESMRKWIHRGWGLLWTIVLLRPAVTLVAKFATVDASQATLAGLTGGVVLLLVAAVAPWLIVAMFPLVASAGLGVGKALMGAAQTAGGLAQLAGRGFRRGSGAAESDVGDRRGGLGRLAGGGPDGGPGGGRSPGDVRPVGGPTGGGGQGGPAANGGDSAGQGGSRGPRAIDGPNRQGAGATGSEDAASAAAGLPESGADHSGTPGQAAGAGRHAAGAAPADTAGEVAAVGQGSAPVDAAAGPADAGPNAGGGATSSEQGPGAGRGVASLGGQAADGDSDQSSAGGPAVGDAASDGAADGGAGEGSGGRPGSSGGSRRSVGGGRWWRGGAGPGFGAAAAARARQSGIGASSDVGSAPGMAGTAPAAGGQGWTPAPPAPTGSAPTTTSGATSGLGSGPATEAVGAAASGAAGAAAVSGTAAAAGGAVSGPAGSGTVTAGASGAAPTAAPGGSSMPSTVTGHVPAASSGPAASAAAGAPVAVAAAAASASGPGAAPGPARWAAPASSQSPTPTPASAPSSTPASVVGPGAAVAGRAAQSVGTAGWSEHPSARPPGRSAPASPTAPAAPAPPVSAGSDPQSAAPGGSGPGSGAPAPALPTERPGPGATTTPRQGDDGQQTNADERRERRGEPK